VWVVPTTYLKHTDKENPETVKAMVKMQARTMLYKMGLSHFSLFVYCLFLLWFCRLLQLIWLCPPHQKKNNLRPKREKRNMNNFPFPFHTENVWVSAETKQGRNRFTHKSINFRINEFIGFLKESSI
jgi:hypothetical protein